MFRLGTVGFGRWSRPSGQTHGVQQLLFGAAANGGFDRAQAQALVRELERGQASGMDLSMVDRLLATRQERFTNEALEVVHGHMVHLGGIPGRLHEAHGIRRDVVDDAIERLFPPETDTDRRRRQAQIQQAQ